MSILSQKPWPVGESRKLVFERNTGPRRPASQGEWPYEKASLSESLLPVEGERMMAGERLEALIEALQKVKPNRLVEVERACPCGYKLDPRRYPTLEDTPLRGHVNCPWCGKWF